MIRLTPFRRLIGAGALILSGTFAGTGASPVVASSTCPSGWTAVDYLACEYRVTTSGDFALPDGWGPFDYLVIGGGGGGGGGSVSPSLDSGDQSLWVGGGGGGGAGGYTLCTGKTGTSVAITLGAGGTGGTGDDNVVGVNNRSGDGGDGESSSAGDCTAAGGKGGNGSGLYNYFGSKMPGLGGRSGNDEFGNGAYVNCSSSWQHPRCDAGSSTFYGPAGGGGGSPGFGNAGYGGSNVAEGGGNGRSGVFFSGLSVNGNFRGATMNLPGSGGGGAKFGGTAVDGGGAGGSVGTGPSIVAATAGTANTGGGGGGGSSFQVSTWNAAPTSKGVGDGAAGGSGVVIIRVAAKMSGGSGGSGSGSGGSGSGSGSSGSGSGGSGSGSGGSGSGGSGSPSAKVPGPPRMVTVVRSGSSAVVTWLPPLSNGGSPITAYKVIASSGQSCTTGADVTQCTVRGLGDGPNTLYGVHAVNAMGGGAVAASTALSSLPETGLSALSGVLFALMLLSVGAFWRRASRRGIAVD